MIQYTKSILTVLVLGLVITSCSTTKTAMTEPTVAKPAMAKNDDVAMKKYMNTIDADQVSERLHVFASDDFEGRRTGTRGQKRAAEYLSNFYHSLGLEGPIKNKANPYLQAINFTESKTNSGSMMLGAKEYKLDTDYAALSGISTDATSDVVFIGYGIETPDYNDFEGLDVKGKTVVMIFGEPTTTDGERLFTFTQNELFQKTEKFFTKKGIANMIITTPNQGMFDAQLPYMKGGRARIALKTGEEDTPAFSTFFMSPKKAAELFGKSSDDFFKSVQDKIDAKATTGGMYAAKDLTVKLDKADRNTESHNVMAYLEGTDLKDEIIVISSHYDLSTMRM